MNNEALVCKLANITKIEGADKIVSAQVVLNGIPLTQVVVGVDTVENTPVVYFDSNLAIEAEVIESIDKNSEGYGTEGFNSLGNYLAKGGRVRCIKLRNTISNGLAVNVDKFYQFFENEKTAKDILIEGYSFTQINGKNICAKWVPVKTSSVQKGKQGKKEKPGTAIIEGHFPEHIDTDQLIRNIHRINPDDVVQLSTKYHGTSSRTGNVLTTRKLSFVEKIAKFLGVKINETEYHYVYGSRRVTKSIDEVESNANKVHFYSVDLWSEAGEKFFKGKLAKGEVVYYEIVGWLPTGAPIQKIGNSVYNYGAKENEYKIYVYRITLTNEEGYIMEYSTQAVKDRCKELNVAHVNELYYGRAKDLYPELDVSEHWHQNFLASLKRDYLEKLRTDCVNAKTFDEGIVIRREIGGIDAFKLKSESFLTAESKALDEEKVSDLEVEG